MSSRYERLTKRRECAKSERRMQKTKKKFLPRNKELSRRVRGSETQDESPNRSMFIVSRDKSHAQKLKEGRNSRVRTKIVARVMFVDNVRMQLYFKCIRVYRRWSNIYQCTREWERVLGGGIIETTSSASAHVIPRTTNKFHFHFTSHGS